MKDSPEQAALYKISKDLMETKLATKPELAAKIIPTFAVGKSFLLALAPKQFLIPPCCTGCRRPTPGNGFLEALCADNTDAITCPIEKITQTGVMTTDGKHHEVDVCVLCDPFSCEAADPDSSSQDHLCDGVQHRLCSSLACHWTKWC